jgi:oxepin-CoA hydrolase/3-oxo-5,6-dehydrosuberyl-CoA semialdehyde dehydrogenase
MRTLKSFLSGRAHEATASARFTDLHDPSTAEPVARASSDGADFAAALAFARREGGPALRSMSFAGRGELLKAMSKALREGRDELLDLSRLNNGTTASDGAFDVDGATGALFYYSTIGKALGDRRTIADGDGVQIGKAETFWGEHVLVPRQGVAVHINAFNFPAWGFGEKAAQAILAGVPVITKPATATALVAERAVERILEAGILPPGALQLICGSTGDLLDRLEPQDVVAFTGSADTAMALRSRPAVLRVNARFNVEADSLNAAVLAPDVSAGSATFDRFVKDVAREVTQKAGQKCTAIRRIFVPAALIDATLEALGARLAKVAVGNPIDPAVTMGPLATASQLEEARAGVGALAREARVVRGGADAVTGAGNGYFLAPTLLHAPDLAAAPTVHSREVFAPVATVLGYDGSAAEASAAVALGGGTLVTSVYTDDAVWLRDFVERGAAVTGRIYVGSTNSDGFGSGAALPQSQHGGPGRAGDGAELGGLAGLKLYLQRAAVQGDKSLLRAALD